MSFILRVNPPLYSPSSRLLWSFLAFCISILILKQLINLHTHTRAHKALVFRFGMHLIYKSVWKELASLQCGVFQTMSMVYHSICFGPP